MVSPSRKCFTLVPDANYSTYTVRYRTAELLGLYSLRVMVADDQMMYARRSACVPRYMICSNHVLACARDQRDNCLLHSVLGRMPTGTGNGLERYPRRDYRGRYFILQNLSNNPGIAYKYRTERLTVADYLEASSF